MTLRSTGHCRRRAGRSRPPDGRRRQVGALAGRKAPRSNTACVASLSRLVLLVAAGAAVLVVSAPTLRDSLPDVEELVPERAQQRSGQSDAQISSAEFAQIRAGLSPRALRDLAGEPASEDSTELEGLRLECLSYGIVGASGIYQFCFADGKLSSKLRFGKR
jgi:hypothetical protein